MDDNARRRRRLPTSGRPPSRRAAAGAVAISVLVAAACGGDSSSVEPQPESPHGPGTVTIGALLPETGPEASTGVAARWLLEHRVREHNELGATQDPPYTIELEAVDTGSDPEAAREAFRELVDEGVKVVVGPVSDAEVKAVADLADSEGVLVASPGSSAISLAVVDNVLRFVPDDGVQAAAIVDLLRHDGVHTITKLGRDDPTNDELLTAVATDLETLGGTSAQEIMYPPDATTYEASVEALADAVAELADVVGPDHRHTVGVVIAGEAEVPELLASAARTAGLDDLRWFGSSGLARSDELLADPAAATFAASVEVPSTTFGLDPTNEHRWGPLVQVAKEQTGVEPDAVALAAYDALDVLVAAIVESGFRAEEASIDEVSDLRTQAVSKSLLVDGVTGSLKLNEFGDRTTGAFDVWSVCEGPAGVEWRRTAVWTPGPDGLTGGTVTGSATC